MSMPILSRASASVSHIMRGIHLAQLPGKSVPDTDKVRTPTRPQQRPFSPPLARRRREP